LLAVKQPSQSEIDLEHFAFETLPSALTVKRCFACASWAGGGVPAPPPEQFQNKIALNLP
jgi:hypothetical protein